MQDFDDYEIIVVDDGSTDNTKDLMSQDEYENVVYVFQPNGGVCSARNHGAKLSKGDYLIFLDSDDYALQGWMTNFSKAISVAGPDVVIGGTRILGKEEVISYSFLPAGFTIRRELFLSVGGYDEILKFGENTELKWRLEVVNANFSVIEDIVRVYDNSTADGGGKNVANKLAYFKHIAAKHADMFAAKPSVAQQQYQVAGIDAFRIHQHSLCRKLLWQGWAKRPANLKAFGRALIYTLRCIF